jgi:Rrf2 family cysteine metabolism transcriptional repressor
MKISTRTRYGIRALLEIACAYNSGPLQIKLIADRQRISNKYLEQLVGIMKSFGLVRSIRGPRGGYVLSRPPEEIKLSEVFGVLEGPILTTDCIDHEDVCPNCADCITRQLWMEMNNAILNVLEGKTLGDLVKMTEKERLNYQI